MRAGLSSTDVAILFLSSDEFAGLYATPQQYVSSLYHMLLGRDAETAGLNSWVDHLNRGEKRADVARALFASSEASSRALDAPLIDRA